MALARSLSGQVLAGLVITFVIAVAALILILAERAKPEPEPAVPPAPIVFPEPPPPPEPISNFTGWVGDSNCASRLRIVNGSVMEQECMPYSSLDFDVAGAIEGTRSNTTLRATSLPAGTYCAGTMGLQSVTTLDGGVLDALTCRPTGMADGLYCGPNNVVQGVIMEDGLPVGFDCRSLLDMPIINDTGVTPGCYDFLTHMICVLDDGRVTIISNYTEIHMREDAVIVGSLTIQGPVKTPEIIPVFDAPGCAIEGSYNVCIVGTGQTTSREHIGKEVAYETTPIVGSTTIGGNIATPELKLFGTAGTYNEDEDKLLKLTTNEFGLVAGVVEGPVVVTRTQLENLVFGGAVNGTYHDLRLLPSGIVAGCYEAGSRLFCFNSEGMALNATYTGVDYIPTTALITSDSLVGSVISPELPDMGLEGTYNAAGNRLLTITLDKYARPTSVVEGGIALTTTTLFNGDVNGTYDSLRLNPSGVVPGCVDFGSQNVCITLAGTIQSRTSTGIAYIPTTQSVTSNTITGPVLAPELVPRSSAGSYGLGGRLWEATINNVGVVTAAATGKRALTEDTTFEGGGFLVGKFDDMQLVSRGIGSGRVGGPNCAIEISYIDQGLLDAVPICHPFNLAGLVNDTLVLMGTPRQINIIDPANNNTHIFSLPQDIDYHADMRIRSLRLVSASQQYAAPIEEGLSIAGSQARGALIRLYTNHSASPLSEIHGLSPARVRWSWNMFTGATGAQTHGGDATKPVRFVEMTDGLFAVGGSDAIAATYTSGDFLHRFTVDDAKTSVLQVLEVKSARPTLQFNLASETSAHVELASSSREDGWLLFGARRDSSGNYILESPTESALGLVKAASELKVVRLDPGAIGTTATPESLITMKEALTTVHTPLLVTGAATLQTTLNVAGGTNLDSTLGVAGATTIDSTLSVIGTITAQNNLAVGNDATITNMLKTSGFRAGVMPSITDTAARFAIGNTGAANADSQALFEVFRGNNTGPSVTMGTTPGGHPTIYFGMYRSYADLLYHGIDANPVFQMYRHNSGYLRIAGGRPTGPGMLGNVAVTTYMEFTDTRASIKLPLELTTPLQVSSGGTGSNTALTGRKIIVSADSQQQFIESSYSVDDLVSAIGQSTARITGTPKQITVAQSGNNFTLSAPQDLAVDSNVVFGTVLADAMLATGTTPAFYLYPTGASCRSAGMQSVTGTQWLTLGAQLQNGDLYKGPVVGAMFAMKQSAGKIEFLTEGPGSLTSACSEITTPTQTVLELSRLSTGKTEGKFDADTVILKNQVVIGDRGALLQKGYQRLTIFGDASAGLANAPVIQLHASNLGPEATIQLGQVTDTRAVLTFGGYFDGAKFISQVGASKKPMHWNYEGNTLQLVMGNGTAATGTEYEGTPILDFGPDVHLIRGDLTIEALNGRPDYPPSVRVVADLAKFYGYDDEYWPIESSFGIWKDGTSYLSHGVLVFANKSTERLSSVGGWLWNTDTAGGYHLTQYASTEGSAVDVRDRIFFDSTRTTIGGIGTIVHDTLEVVEPLEPSDHLTYNWARTMRLDRRLEVGTSADGNGWLLFGMQLTQGGAYRGRSLTNGFGLRHSSNQMDLLVGSVPGAVGDIVTATTLLRFLPTGTTSYRPLTVTQTFTASGMADISTLRIGAQPSSYDTDGPRFAFSNTGGAFHKDQSVLSFYLNSVERSRMEVGVDEAGRGTLNFGCYYHGSAYRAYDTDTVFRIKRSSGVLDFLTGSAPNAGLAGSVTFATGMQLRPTGLSLSQPLAVSSGGTGSSATLVTGRVIVSSGQTLVHSALTIASITPTESNWFSSAAAGISGTPFRIKYVRLGNYVTVYFYMANSVLVPLGSHQLDYTIPTGYRPVTPHASMACTKSVSTMSMSNSDFCIYASGAIAYTVETDVTVQAALGSVSYPIS